MCAIFIILFLQDAADHEDWPSKVLPAKRFSNVLTYDFHRQTQADL
jgi:hypothetical protein